MNVLLRKRFNLLLVLGLSNLVSVALILVRYQITSQYVYLFFIWNLFLAFIPLAVSSVLLFSYRKMPFFVLWFLVGFWLLFFPNAPYILTDFLHLRPRTNIPLWFDLIMIATCAWNGLLMGFVSLMDVQEILSKRFNQFFAWIFVLFSLVLASFGVYLGRYLRWNSWDIITQPTRLLRDIANRLLHPMLYTQTFGVTILLSSFLIVAYLTLRQLTSHQRCEL
jgi:uncharacterized membrane protein